ncbi:acyl carrier protein [bacterium BMS3Bbin14]|nr:acyl carrier protein [bacterium BMS3Bbin14]HDL98200.1 acyl carrier protein [Desulfobacteraceae bacterium]
MDNSLISDIKNIITDTVGRNVIPDPLPDDYQLVGNLLDSLAVTNLIIALEEYFGFIFNDDELSAEAFETVLSLAELVSGKIKA